MTELKPHPVLSDKHVLAILSPSNIVKLPFFKEHLKQVFPHVDIVAPRGLEHLEEVIERSHSTHGVVLAIGGDGTLHQVLRRLDVKHQILGLLPAGTGNDVARTIDYPKQLKDRIAHLTKLTPKLFDYGMVNGTRYINSAGFGIDSDVLHLRQQSKGFMARNYNAAFLVSLMRLNSRRVRIDCDGEQLDGSYFWVLAMITPCIGGGTRIAPKALVDDGMLDIVLVKETGKLNLLKFLPVAVRGEHLDLELVVYRQARTITITPESNVDYLAVDGELILNTGRAITITVQGGSLRFLR